MMSTGGGRGESSGSCIGDRRDSRYERGTLERTISYSTTLHSVDKALIFDGNEATFAAWKWRVEHRLAKLKLTHTLLRTPANEEFFNPVAGATAAQEEERKATVRKRLDEDVAALDEIIMAVNNEVLNKIVGVEYAKDAMDTLVKTYQKSGTAALVTMRERLFSIKYRVKDSLRKIIDEFDLIIRELERMNSAISHEEKVHALLSAIPDRYKHVKGALLVLSNQELCLKSLAEIKRMFLDAEDGEEKPKEHRNIALKSKKDVRCFGCNELGHYKNKCPLMKKFVAKEREKYKQNIKRTHAMMAGNKKAPATNTRKVRFVVDSGASDHMVKDEELLEDIQELDDSIIITTAKSGENLRATKMGKIKLRSVIGKNSIKKLELYNVLFIPGLEENLLSVRKASKRGKRVTFTNEEVIFENGEEIIATGNYNDGLFHLELVWEGKSAEPRAYVGNKISIETWHKRLGHLSSTGMEKLLKKGMIEGINLTSDEISKAKVCDACLAGKQAANKYQQMELPRSKRPLELVHSDVCGSMEEQTYDGYRYFVTFIDDYTHFVVVYLMEHKSEVFEKFKEYEALVCSHFGTRISKFRCDNGGEYTNTKFQSHCKKQGIQMMFTVPYTPQQNGVSEQMNRTLMEKIAYKRDKRRQNTLRNVIWENTKRKTFKDFWMQSIQTNSE